jgi:hypothetical protein
MISNLKLIEKHFKKQGNHMEKIFLVSLLLFGSIVFASEKDIKYDSIPQGFEIDSFSNSKQRIELQCFNRFDNEDISFLSEDTVKGMKLSEWVPICFLNGNPFLYYPSDLGATSRIRLHKNGIVHEMGSGLVFWKFTTVMQPNEFVCLGTGPISNGKLIISNTDIAIGDDNKMAAYINVKDAVKLPLLINLSIRGKSSEYEFKKDTVKYLKKILNKHGISNVLFMTIHY